MFANAIKAELDAAAAIKAKAAAENRAITEAELSAMEKHAETVKALKAREAKAAELEASLADASAPAPRRSASAQPRVEVGADLLATDPNKGFKSSAHYLAAVIEDGMGRKAKGAQGLRYLATVGSDEQSGSSSAYGGFLIPEGFRAELLGLNVEEDLLGARTMKVPMQTPTVHLPVLGNSSHATSVVGGITSSFTPETAEASLSRSTFERVTLSVNDLVTMVAVTDNLVQDSPLSIAAIMAQTMGKSARAQMLNKRLNGTGVGEPMGILKSGALIAVGSSNSDAITVGDLFGMLSRFWSNSGQGLWLANRTTMPKIGALGSNGVNVFQPSLQTGVPNRLLGYDLMFTEFLPENTEANALILVDPGCYLDGVYGGEQYSEDASVRFLARERILRLVNRVDGRPWVRSAITHAVGSTTLTPFVSLADRS